MIIAEQAGPAEDVTRNVLLSMAYSHSRGTFLSTLCDLVDADDKRFQTASTLDSLGSFWNDNIGALVVEFLWKPIKPKTTAVRL